MKTALIFTPSDLSGTPKKGTLTVDDVIASLNGPAMDALKTADYAVFQPKKGLMIIVKDRDAAGGRRGRKK